MKVIGLDHLVLTVKSIAATIAFYERVLGMAPEVFGPDKRSALRFGPHKINLHQADNMFEPRAEQPTMGSGDLCFLVDDVGAVKAQLEANGVAILEGPVERTGARGRIISYYLRDPDLNLIELSQYLDGTKPAA